MNDKKRFNITFPNLFLKALRIVAAHEEKSIAEIVRIACDEYLRAHHRDLFLQILYPDPTKPPD